MNDTDSEPAAAPAQQPPSAEPIGTSPAPASQQVIGQHPGEIGVESLTKGTHPGEIRLQRVLGGEPRREGGEGIPSEH